MSPGRVRFPRRLRHPVAQLAVAVGVMVGGAVLVGLWMVGLVLIAAGGLVAADAVLRDTSTPSRPQVLPSHDDVLERYRRAR